MVEVEVTGCNGFSVTTVRRNPAARGAVTGSATYASFWSSVQGESCFAVAFHEVKHGLTPFSSGQFAKVTGVEFTCAEGA